jgi:hypothetical protein
MKVRVFDRRHPNAMVGIGHTVMVDVVGLELAFRRRDRHFRAADALCDAEIPKPRLPSAISTAWASISTTC